MRIKKTATELKQEALMRSYNQSRKAKQRHKERKKAGFKKKVKPPYESEKHLRQMTYKEFLQSKYWQLVRKKVLARDDYKCVICRDDVNLHVHHDTYKHHFKELENLGDLMTLCAVCHKEHHYAQD